MSDPRIDKIKAILRRYGMGDYGAHDVAMEVLRAIEPSYGDGNALMTINPAPHAAVPCVTTGRSARFTLGNTSGAPRS